MASPAIRPETHEERVIYNTIVWTWGFWSIGALYIVAPVVGWYLAYRALQRYAGVLEKSGSKPVNVPIGVSLWWISMAGMLFALVAAHITYELGFAMMLKSTIGWAKGWALMAVFPWIGAMLRIRASLIYRATNVLALQTLLLCPVFVGAALAHLPHPLFISPLQIVGGPGPEYFCVELYSIDNTNGNLRWNFFAPWAPAAAFVANVSFVFALYERDRMWKWIGIASCVVICLMTQSRLALIAIPGVLLLGAVLFNLTQPIGVGIGAVFSTIGILSTAQISQMISDFTEKFNGARAASTRVRALLRSIALQRWWSEAPVFGHGIVEKGPHIVEHMPIGSHHSWFGLLFVKGAVGFISLAIPLAWTIGEMIVKGQMDRVARCALGVVVIITFYTFGENLEILAYLFWPGLVVIGIAMRRRVFHPFRRRFENRRPSSSNC
jgi:hypothetical protein